MKPIYSDILKELRRDRKLTQKDMGDLMGISQTTYCDYENGVRRMPLAMLSFLADTLDTSTDYILGRTPRCGPTPNGPRSPERKKTALRPFHKKK